MNRNQNNVPSRIGRRAVHQGPRPGVPIRAPIEKSTTGSKTKLLKCKRSILISTFNVRTLSPISQIPELVASAISQKIDIICIQEHRIFHNNFPLMYHDLERKWTLITSSATKNSGNCTIGGVGLLLSPLALESLNSVEKISSRIVIASFNGNPALTVIASYSPTNVTDEQDVIDFYDELSPCVRSVPKHNVLIIGGDMNAHLGRDKAQHKFSYHERTNRNGEHLQTFLMENKLVCLNTRFQKRIGKKWTHTHPNGYKSQIDFLFINKKWTNSCHNCEAYNSFYGVSSDHRITSVRICLSLRKNKIKKATKPCYDWSQLSKNPDIKNAYTIEVQNRFDALQLSEQDPTPNSTYENFIQSHQIAAEKFIPLRPKIKSLAPWENDIVTLKREKLKTLTKQISKYPTRQSQRAKDKALKELNETYLEEQQKYIQTQIDKINDASANQQSSLAWKIVNNISGRKKSPKSKLKAKTQSERIELWKNHFQSLLGNEPSVNDQPMENIIENELDICTNDFTMDELVKVLKKCKNRKAAGLDDIPPEVWKTENFNEILLQCCNSVYHQNEIEIWKKGCIYPSLKRETLASLTTIEGLHLPPSLQNYTTPCY